MPSYYNHKDFYSIQNLPNEVWKDVDEFKGIFKVSNMGRVKRLKLKKFPKMLRRDEYIMPQYLTDKRRDYLAVGLYVNGKCYARKVHRLVGLAFLSNPENKKTINHIKGIKTDNRATELEWATYSEQNIHAYKTGLLKSGENHPNAKNSDKDILFIRQSKMKIKDLAKQFNMSTSSISVIRKGEQRKAEYVHLNITK
jgi:hypothetical protein